MPSPAQMEDGMCKPKEGKRLWNSPGDKGNQKGPPRCNSYFKGRAASCKSFRSAGARAKDKRM